MVISTFLIEADRFLVESRWSKGRIAIPDDLLQQYANHILLFAQIEMQLEAFKLVKKRIHPLNDPAFFAQLAEIKMEPTEIYIPTPWRSSISK